MKKMYTGFFMAWGCFTQIPCPKKIWDEQARKWMLALMPLAGLVCGLVQLGLYGILNMGRDSGLIAEANALWAALLTVAPFAVCGFIHLDGYMDVSDAVLSRRDLEKRREILKDSTIGAFAVIMVVLFFMIYFGAMSAIVAGTDALCKLTAMVTVPLVARGMSSRDVLIRKPMEVSQYLQMDREKTVERYVGIILSLGAAALCIGISMAVFHEWKYALAAPLAAFAGQATASSIARRNLQGMNGDIAGFSIVIGEAIGAVVIGLI